jgi:hypothetical protein
MIHGGTRLVCAMAHTQDTGTGTVVVAVARTGRTPQFAPPPIASDSPQPNQTTPMMSGLRSNVVEIKSLKFFVKGLNENHQCAAQILSGPACDVVHLQSVMVLLHMIARADLRHRVCGMILCTHDLFQYCQSSQKSPLTFLTTSTSIAAAPTTIRQ